MDIVDKSLTNEIAVPSQYLFFRDSCQLTFVIVRKTSRKEEGQREAWGKEKEEKKGRCSLQTNE